MLVGCDPCDVRCGVHLFVQDECEHDEQDRQRAQEREIPAERPVDFTPGTVSARPRQERCQDHLTTAPRHEEHVAHYTHGDDDGEPFAVDEIQPLRDPLHNILTHRTIPPDDVGTAI